MDNYVIAALCFIGAVLFFSGFFVGRSERSSVRVARAHEPTENRVGWPL